MRFLGNLVAGFALMAGAVAADAQELRLGLITPPPHQWTRSAGALAEKLSAETEGRLKLSVFPAGQLGSEAQMLQQLQSGALDLAFLTVGEIANRDEEFNILVAPYLVKNGEEAARMLEGKVATDLQGKLGKLGLKGLGYAQAGMRIVLLSQPLGADGTVKGRKIRTVPISSELDFWTKAGAAPTALPLPDLFDAYANGQIDGMQLDVEGTFNTRYYDYSKAVLDTQHMIFPMIAVASGRKWQSLSADDRALIERLVGEEATHIRRSYPQIDASYKEKLAGLGVTVEAAGAEVFGTAVDDWYAAWRLRTPRLIELEAEVKALRGE